LCILTFYDDTINREEKKLDKWYKPSPFGLGLSPAIKMKYTNIHNHIRQSKFYRNNPYHKSNNERGQTTMKITFDRYEETKTNPNPAGKTYNIIRVHGTALEGKLEGQDWSTQIFASAKDMVDQVKALSKGDTVNVKMTKNGKFWNAAAFEKESGPAPTTATSGGGQVMMGSPTDPRAKNLKTASHILGPKPPKKDMVEWMQDLGRVADLVEAYIDKKGVFQFDSETMGQGIPDVDDATENAEE
jgi:hypothetical protein